VPSLRLSGSLRHPIREAAVWHSRVFSIYTNERVSTLPSRRANVSWSICGIHSLALEPHPICHQGLKGVVLVSKERLTARIVIRCVLQTLALDLNERLQLTPPIRPLATRRKTGAERNGALADKEMDV